MGHIIDALKVLFTRTPSEGKYFPVTKSNGEIQGQISQAELVAAVKEALPGILADQSTSFANILTKNASGALGTATIVNMASVLGGVDSPASINGYGAILSQMVFNLPHSCQSIQDSNSSTVTISPSYFGGGSGGRCSILLVSQNTLTPSIFVLGRKTVVGTIYEGDIKQTNLSFNADGSLTVTKTVSLSLYFRVLVMEW